MKKSLILLAMAVLLVIGTGPAMAGGYDYEASTTIEFDAITSGHSYDRSNYGYGNDDAYAVGSGGMTGEMELEAKGHHGARVKGDFVGIGDVDTKACAWDSGYTSGAKAETKASGYAFGIGSAKGKCGPESAEGFLKFKGNLYEDTFAAETGYSAGGISAEQSGRVKFSDKKSMETWDSRRSGKAYVGGCHGGDAKVKGESFVSIDPNGPNRSLFGKTSTCVDAPGKVNVNMSGRVGGDLFNGGSYAGGVASYAVNGGNANNTLGKATLDAQINNSGSYTTVKVSGSAYAGPGSCCGQQTR